jgi:hypothetical protein
MVTARKLAQTLHEEAAMSTNVLIQHLAAQFGRTHLGGIPCLLNDDGAFLSFISAAEPPLKH